MKPSRRKQVLGILLVCLASGTCVSWPIFTSKNFGKPLSRSIPVEPPDEANRVHHPLGFSLVYPPNWEIHVEGPPESLINGYPRSLIPSRSSGVLHVRRLGDEKPDLSTCRLVDFQGKPAYEHVSWRAGNWDDPPRFSYGMTFQRNGVWFYLAYMIGVDRQTLPEMIRFYFNTFRYDELTKKAP